MKIKEIVNWTGVIILLLGVGLFVCFLIGVAVEVILATDIISTFMSMMLVEKLAVLTIAFWVIGLLLVIVSGDHK